MEKNASLSSDDSDDSFGDVLQPSLYPTCTPLNHEWIWRFIPPNSEWVLQDVFRFSTVEEFWSLVQNIKVVAQLIKDTAYAMSMVDFYPDYSTVENSGGGRWVCYLKYPSKYKDEKKYQTIMDKLENKWRQLLCMCIGETVCDVVGIVLDYRQSSIRISVWMKESTEENILAVANYMKTILITEYTYINHEDCAGGIPLGRAKVSYRV